MSVNGLTRKWERCDTYGGSLAENVTQAVARDLLADAIVRCEAADCKVTFHVHDEIVAEAPLRARGLDKLSSLMRTAPAWAEGLPVAVSGWAGQRYRKD
jgi:DNA polymerase